MIATDSAKEPSGQRLRLLALTAYFGVAFGANLLAVSINAAVSTPLFQLQNGRALMNAFALPLWLLAVTFIAPTVCAIVYLWPIYRESGANFRRGQLSEKVLARILNAPIASASVGAIGWLLGLCYGLALQVLQPNPAAQSHLFSFVLLLNLLSFAFCFVFIYFSLETFNRRRVIPRLFPAGGLSHVAGALTLSTPVRLYIFFIAVGPYPIFLLFIYTLFPLEELVDYNLIPTAWAIAFGGVLAGAVVTFLLARTYQKPLLALKAATDAIRRGDFTVSVPVVSRDELGALSESVNEMALALHEKETIRDVFGKFVDPEVRDFLLKGELQLGGAVQHAAVLFADLRNFTGISETLPPERVVEMLNLYFERMSACIAREGGLINKYIGDAILAVFGAPNPRSDRADAALRAANAMRRELGALNAVLAERGLPPLDNGVGVHAGEVLAGNIGSSFRMEYTVIGDGVNLASRLEGLTKRLQIPVIVSDAAVSQLVNPAAFELRSVGLVRVKGKAEPVRIHALEA